MVHQWRRAGCCLRGRSTEMASHQSPSERGMAGEEIPGGTEGRSEQSGNCLHWLQNVDPDSKDVSPVCIRYTDV